MEDDRLPKVCLREIIRGIKNKNETRWRNGFRKRWNGWGETTVAQDLLNEENRKRNNNGFRTENTIRPNKNRKVKILPILQRDQEKHWKG